MIFLISTSRAKEVFVEDLRDSGLLGQALVLGLDTVFYWCYLRTLEDVYLLSFDNELYRIANYTFFYDQSVKRLRGVVGRMHDIMFNIPQLAHANFQRDFVIITPSDDH